MTDTALLSRLGQALLDVLDPLRQALQSPEGFEELMRRQGWLPPPTREYFATVRDAFGAVDALEDASAAMAALLDGDQPDIAEVLTAVDRLSKVMTDLRTLARPAATLPAPFDSDEFWNTFPGDLVADLFTRYLELALPALFAPLHLLGILDEEPVPAGGVPNRIAFVRSRVEWNRLVMLVSDPTSLGRDVYGWGATFKHDVLTGRLERVLLAFGVPAGRYVPQRSLSDRYYGDAPPPDSVRELRVPLVEERRDGIGSVRVGLAVLPIPPSGSPSASPTGFFIGPYAHGQAAGHVPLGGLLALELKGGLEDGGDVGVEVRPGELGAHLGTTGAELDVEAAISFEPPQPYLLIGSEDSHRIQLGRSRLGLSLTGPAASPDLQLTLQAQSLWLVFDPSEGDSFVTDLFGTDPKTVEVAAGLTWSSQTGLHWTGTAGLSLSVPMHATFGPLTVQEIRLAIETADNDVSLTVAASAAAAIGPVQVVVTDIGVQLALAPISAPARGVFGDLDLQFGFKPPRGAGLSVDVAGVITGGGFLRYEEASGQYSGVVQLMLEGGIAVDGIGLIATRMPDGGEGYSLLVIITAKGFEPIPLPLGFRLTGIGGLLAVNRTFAEDSLRAGLKNHALDSVMFPQDPIRNAPQILSNLNKLFPPATGSFLVGPMAQLEWGTPTLLTAQIAVVLEFGARLRLLVLAQITAILPEPKNDLIRLQLDAVGVVDFDQGTAAVDATLYDSRLLQKFVLTGDMALRLKWAAPPTFALAVGGLHPAFNPPPNFPKLERIAINLAAGDNPRIRCEAYLALTGSSIQFGARAELYASAAGFSIQGEIGFDVLIQRDPFAFLAEFYAQVQLKRGATNLFKVRVEGALAGPRPLHVKAKATFEILWWDMSIRVDRTLVSGERPPLPAPVDVLPLLLAALGLAGSWTAQLPAGQQQGVTLRGRPELAGEILLHPLGRLTVSQAVVPLGMDISRFGDAAPTGARRFTIGRVTPEGQTESPEAVRGFFAPAQFFEMSDNEKLSRPSFESLPAGVNLGADGFAISANHRDWLEVPAIEFETIIVGQEPDGAEPPPPPAPYQLTAVSLGKQARFGAAANSGLRHTGAAKYRTTSVGKHRVAKEGWSIVATDDLTVQAAPGMDGTRPGSYSEAEQALRRLRREQPDRAADLTILRRRSEVGEP